MPDPLILRSDDSRLEVSASDGGRATSFVVRGDELLVTEGYGPIMWGAYPMVPFAGRIRHGAFRFAGHDVRLPLNDPPHALHGTVFDRPWAVVDDRTLTIDLGPVWPFAGRLTQRFELDEGSLGIELRLDADEAMPVSVGWHPWFRRRLTGTATRPRATSAPVGLRFEPRAMYQRDHEGIPSGKLVDPSAGPWDDCFTDLVRPPVLTWPGRLALELTSTCDHWVVFSEPHDTLCVEPQSGPPDAANLDPRVVEAGRTIVETMRWRWWVPTEP